jgi:streptogramin lyase
MLLLYNFSAAGAREISSEVSGRLRRKTIQAAARPPFIVSRMTRPIFLALTLAVPLLVAGGTRRPTAAEPRAATADSALRSADWLGLLPDGIEKRRFILDCTGCHQIDDQVARPGGRARTQREFNDAIDKMLSFSGSTTGFPVIGHGRDAATTSAWLAQYFVATPKPRPRAALPANARITEYALPDSADLPHDVAVGADGRVVVTGMMSHRMWVLDAARGAFEGVDIPIERANPRALEIDRNGDWWVVLGARHRVARYREATRTWRTWAGGFYPHSVALAGDGAAWINGHFTHAPEVIARVDTSIADSARSVTRFELPSHPTLGRGPGGPIPYEIRVAPDGRVWTSELQGNRLIAFDPVRKTSEVFTMPDAWSGPRRFDIDRRGILWIPAYSTNELVRLDPATRRFTRFPLPEPNAVPYVVKVDDESGRIWIGSSASDAIYAYDPTANRFTIYPLPSRGALVRHLAIDARTRDLWIAYGASPARIPAKIARLQVEAGGGGP